MTNPLDISGPATLTVLSGTGTLSSLDVLPPGGIAISGAAGTLNVQVIAGNAAAALSAGATGGATVSANGNTLSVTGTEAQVNVALASLELVEPATVASDVLTLSATSPGALGAQTNILVDVVPETGPAFVAPATLVTLQPNALDALPDLLLSDPVASGLAAMGLGREETLTLTLSVTTGLLFLPGYTAASAIAASGLGTGTIALSFTADDIGALNSLLAGLEFAGPAGGEHLNYVLRNAAGVLPGAMTYGNIFLNIAGSAGSNGTLSAGSQTVVLGGETPAGTLDVTGVTAILGNISGAGSVLVAPGASLELPDNALFLGGTSLDFGTISATTLISAGTLLIADGANFSAPVLLGTSALLDFTGTLVADGAETLDFQDAVSLAAGAVLSGDGMLLAGNFSESGMITGPGTILAGGGDTLVLAAGSVGGGAELEVASGGVMELGPVSPLFGIFLATPLSIDNSVTLSFLNNGMAAVSGGFADTLGGSGGAFIISGPQAFSGTIENFAPGDQLIFPDLTDFSVLNATQNSCEVAGVDGEGNTDTDEIHANIPAGATLVAGMDAEGDPDVLLRSAAATILPQQAVFLASAHIAQPLQGLRLAMIASTTQSLTLTLSVVHGVISTGTFGPAAKLTLTATGIAAMNAELAGLTYTGTGLTDTLALASSTGILNGLLSDVVIEPAAPGTVSGYSGVMFSEGQVVTLGADGGFTQFTAPMAPGELRVASTTEFDDTLQVNGISGTALDVNAGASAIFGAAASVTLGQDITLGDAGGPGTLVIITGAFSGSGNMTLASSTAAAGSAADVLGALSLAGTLEVGADAAALLYLSSSLTAGAAVLGSGGTIFADAGAVADFGAVTDAGILRLDNAAQASATALMLSGALSLGGTASLQVAGLLELTASGASLQLGTDAGLQTGTLALAGGAVADAGFLAVATSVSVRSGALVSLSGGTIDTPLLSLAGALEGYGVLDAGAMVNSGMILAQGGAMLLGSLDNAGTVEVGPSAALVLAGGMSGAPVAFQGGAGLVTVDDLASFTAGATNFFATDAIDLVGVAPSLVSYSGGTNGEISVLDTLGSTISSFGLEILGGQPSLTLLSDGGGGSLITLGDELPCFARGTGLLTPHGYRAVETLKPGDPLITANGARRPVRWIGRRTLDLSTRNAGEARPVLIEPGAFGQGLPSRRLRLSPLHCVHADGVLIPAAHLVNGATILREPAVAAMTYYHVELDRHDILLAEGLPCESYFDSGNRGALYHETGRRSPARRPFAPTVTAGPRLAALRRRLHDIALAAGFSLTYWPVLRALASGETVLPEIRRAGRSRLAAFRFSAPVRDILLLSGTACPADTDPASEDRRELGVCVAESDHLQLGQGFYPRGEGDAGVWMGRSGALQLERGQADCTLALAAIVQSWVKPAVDVRARGS